jgi:hypothetical protein
MSIRVNVFLYGMKRTVTLSGKAPSVVYDLATHLW